MGLRGSLPALQVQRRWTKTQIVASAKIVTNSNIDKVCVSTHGVWEKKTQNVEKTMPDSLKILLQKVGRFLQDFDSRPRHLYRVLTASILSYCGFGSARRARVGSESKRSPPRKNMLDDIIRYLEIFVIFALIAWVCIDPGVLLRGEDET